MCKVSSRSIYCVDGGVTLNILMLKSYASIPCSTGNQSEQSGSPLHTELKSYAELLYSACCVYSLRLLSMGRGTISRLRISLAGASLLDVILDQLWRVGLRSTHD